MFIASASVLSIAHICEFAFAFRHRFARYGTLLGLLFCITGAGSCQSAYFNGAQSTVGSGFSEPVGVATDSAGNLYVADEQAFAIYEIMAVNGTIPTSPTIKTLLGSLSNPQSIAVDGNGNVYFTDLDTTNGITNMSVKEIVAVNGVIPGSPTVRSLGNGLFYPRAVTVDNNGNVYVADTHNNSIKEILAVNGTIPDSPTIVTLSSEFTSPNGVKVDSRGNVFVTQGQYGPPEEILALNGSIPSSPTIISLASSFAFCAPGGVTVDASGNVYVSDYCNHAVFEIPAVNGTVPSSPKVRKIGAGFSSSLNPTGVAVDGNGNVYVGAQAAVSVPSIPKISLRSGDYSLVQVAGTTAPITMSFAFNGSHTLGSTAVLTKGAPNQDFTDKGTGTCIANTAYSNGQSCTVDVSFVPKVPGVRLGAVVLKDSAGNLLATGYAQGTGVGPQVSFSPGIESVIPTSGLAGPIGIAVDGSGSVYVADNQNSRLVKLSYSGGTYTQSTIATGLSDPYTVVVDGAGDVYVADTANSRILKLMQIANGYVQSTVDSGFGYPYGVAVDGSGTVYIANDLVNGSGQILRETPSDGGYVRSVAVNGLASPSDVAVDGIGNLYISDIGNNGLLLKETLSAGGYLQSTISVPQHIYPKALTVDSIGNLFFTDGSTYNIFEEQLTPNGYVQKLIVGDLHSIIGPWGISLDGDNNLYIAYPGKNQVIKASFAAPPIITFQGTSVGSTSPDSPQTVTLTNAGNAELTFPIPASGNNPSISANFTLDENAPSACPVTGSAAATEGVLAAGASCVLPIGFAPTTTGSLSGSLVLSDNNLNAGAPGYATQAITLSGTGAAPLPAAMSSPAPGSTLTGASTMFTWTAGTGVTGYYLWVGTAPGTYNLVNMGKFTTTSTTVTLPTAGATIYVRLWSVINGTPSQYNDYTYTEASDIPATIISPVNGSTLSGSSTTFTWNAGTGVTGYYLWVGTAPGAYNLVNMGKITTTSTTASLPTAGATIYVRLWSVINGTPSQYNDYTFTEASTVPAVIISPVNGSTLSGSATTFTWTQGTGVTGYYLWIGTAPGTYNLANLGKFTTTSTTVMLPNVDAAIYVRLWSVINGTPSQYNDYTYTETSTVPAAIVSPALGSTLSGATTTFSWTTGTGVTGYYLWVGTAPGTYNLANMGKFTTTSATVTLPTTGAPIYVRLWSVINGTPSRYNDYTYTEASQ